jgi:hypothetical protein
VDQEVLERSDIREPQGFDHVPLGQDHCNDREDSDRNRNKVTLPQSRPAFLLKGSRQDLVPDARLSPPKRGAEKRGQPRRPRYQTGHYKGEVKHEMLKLIHSL